MRGMVIDDDDFGGAVAEGELFGRQTARVHAARRAGLAAGHEPRGHDGGRREDDQAAKGFTAAKYPGRIFYLSTGGTGSVPCLVISDGTNWKQVAIGANAI